MIDVTELEILALFNVVQVDARIYLWKWNTRVVISDVDGTITKYVYISIMAFIISIVTNLHEYVSVCRVKHAS